MFHFDGASRRRVPVGRRIRDADFKRADPRRASVHGDQDKAARASQELPETGDTEQHADLLDRLDVDPKQLLRDLGGGLPKSVRAVPNAVAASSETQADGRMTVVIATPTVESSFWRRSRSTSRCPSVPA
jgi:hypothetical protein